MNLRTLVFLALAGCGSVTAAAQGDDAGNPADAAAVIPDANAGAGGNSGAGGAAAGGAGSSGTAGAAAGQAGQGGAAGASSGGAGGAPDGGPGTVSELPCPADWTIGADSCPDVNGSPCRVCYQNSTRLRCRTSSGVYCVPTCGACLP